MDGLKAFAVVLAVVCVCKRERERERERRERERGQFHQHFRGRSFFHSKVFFKAFHSLLLAL